MTRDTLPAAQDSSYEDSCLSFSSGEKLTVSGNTIFVGSTNNPNETKYAYYVGFRAGRRASDPLGACLLYSVRKLGMQDIREIASVIEANFTNNRHVEIKVFHPLPGMDA